MICIIISYVFKLKHSHNSSQRSLWCVEDEPKCKSEPLTPPHMTSVCYYRPRYKIYNNNIVLRVHLTSTYTGSTMCCVEAKWPPPRRNSLMHGNIMPINYKFIFFSALWFDALAHSRYVLIVY